jgi:hypothetical protein
MTAIMLRDYRPQVSIDELLRVRQVRGSPGVNDAFLPGYN